MSNSIATTGCQHSPDDQFREFVLRRTETGEYFPLTRYRCVWCGEEFVTDGIAWALQGIPPCAIFEPEPEGDEVIVDLLFIKFRARRRRWLET